MVNVTASRLEMADTFAVWRDKINSHADDLEALALEIEVGAQAFGFNLADSVGLTAMFFGGRVRDGSIVETVVDHQFNLAANSQYVITIVKQPDIAPTMAAYLSNAVPVEFVIPVGRIFTGASSITQYVDLRTEYNTSAGTAANASGILQFDKEITKNTVIPSNRNALSISPVVADGVTVTVSEGSEWVVL